MYKKNKLIVWILATCTWFAVVASPAYTNITKTLAQTPSVQKQCTDSQIKRYIQQINNNDYKILDRVLVCRSKSIPVLIKALSSQDELMRMSAIALLGKLGSDAAPIVPTLTKLLDSESEDVRIITVDTFGKIGKEAVPALVKALSDRESWKVRYIATDALGRIGKSGAKPAVPTLIETLKDEDLYVSTEAADTLAKIGKDAVPALITALQDKNWFVRYSAADILRQIGGDAKDALPALSIALKDENDRVSTEANNALVKIRSEPKNQVLSRIKTLANQSQNESVYEAIRERTECNFQGISVQSCDTGQTSTATVRMATSEVIKNPPLICRVPALRAIFRWKCP
jgi:HEAT repeat protein